MKTCEKCNTPLITYKKKKKIIVECPYCGSRPEDLTIDDLGVK